jgi:hypothetical protein
LSDEKKACELLSNPNNEFCQTLLNKGLCDIAPNGHALAMAGQFITFRRNACPVNEQKVEIFILLFNRVFSAGTAAQ